MYIVVATKTIKRQYNSSVRHVPKGCASIKVTDSDSSVVNTDRSLQSGLGKIWLGNAEFTLDRWNSTIIDFKHSQSFEE